MADKLTIQLSGGLGNQMFQYSFGRALASRRQDDLLLDLSGFDRAEKGVTARDYALAPFRIRAEVARDERPVRRVAVKVMRRMPGLALRAGIRYETDEDFCAPAMADRDSRYFVGYWQSPIYFDDCASEIFEDFSRTMPLSDSAQDFIRQIDPANSIMLHVRRGDYVSLSSAAAHHGVTELGYYHAAIAACRQKVSDAQFYIFSDDIGWCREALVIEGANVTYIEPDPARSSWEDMAMMSYCHHQIIANSSFSWWSAWMADRRYGTADRLIFAPLQWFLHKSIDPERRFPPHWVSL